MSNFTETRQLRLRMFANDQDNTCPMCNLTFPDDLAGTEIDHIIPKSRGGPDERWNLRLLHRRCNRFKFAGVTTEAEALAAEHGITIKPLEHCPAYWRVPDRIRGPRPVFRPVAIPADCGDLC